MHVRIITQEMTIAFYHDIARTTYEPVSYININFIISLCNQKSKLENKTTANVHEKAGCTCEMGISCEAALLMSKQ